MMEEADEVHLADPDQSDDASNADGDMEVDMFSCRFTLAHKIFFSAHVAHPLMFSVLNSIICRRHFANELPGC